MRILISIVSLIAIALAATLAALGPGTRFGLWDYSAALSVMRQIALPLLVATGAGGLGLILALWKARGLALFALVAFVSAGAAAYAPIKMRAMAMANPFIHDVTTDFEDPPQILAAAGSDRKNPPAYDGAEIVRGSDKTVAEAQREAFPDILPIMSDAGLETAVKAVREVVSEMGMQILAEGPVSDAPGSGWRVEAVATSFWYGFKDDFIVRIRPAPEGGVRIDVRSQSRVGLSDLGANAKRVRIFLQKLDAAI